MRAGDASLCDASPAESVVTDIPPLPDSVDPTPTFSEDWSTGVIDPARWYTPRKKWGDGNHGVVPENLRVEPDTVFGRKQNVLVVEAHGDQYAGSIVGLHGAKPRVGGLIVSKPFLGSGRFEVVMKIGSPARNPRIEGGPADPMRPVGSVPAIWTYAYRFVRVDDKHIADFVPHEPLYNPHMPRYGIASNEYWSELDFPEFGKAGVFDRAMYNTFCQNRHHPELFDVAPAIDGEYHTYTTDWHTHLVDLPNVTDAQVVEHLGYHWVADKAVPFDAYLGNPLKRLGPDRYAVYMGRSATHYLDGKKIAENTRFVPAMPAQLNLGVWLPDWAGPAPWQSATICYASVRYWPFQDPGDAPGILTTDLPDDFDPTGKPLH